MSNPTHEEARWLIAHAKETNKVEWLAGWDSGRNYGKLCAEERIIKLLEEHVWQLDIAPDKSWKQRCRCGFYGVFNEHLTALIKGKK